MLGSLLRCPLERLPRYLLLRRRGHGLLLRCCGRGCLKLLIIHLLLLLLLVECTEQGSSLGIIALLDANTLVFVPLPVVYLRHK